ncbi:MAG: 3-hydroxyacyl-CoA dehydrogenase [Thermonema sp.]|uniref:3-hydroxyacyl-CoA dehydrogenase/enoyl-CoA hydratase family protein n=1 Tax=Thermonema TaxID=28194 RepID=UPI00068D8A81|nr:MULTISPECIES: 3-hydroxyacyl-CoA dehydrogenase/enoyl-CoA hydratase family protein [Thermonema]GIV39398.1 MAG: 3-hydroxyacyl-CoA dehydrogenase [Thermonema sp.]
METALEKSKQATWLRPSERRRIRKVAVLGAGVMGSGIACHFANIGVEVLLLDIVPRELTEAEKAKGLTLQDKVVRNRQVTELFQKAVQSKPAPLYAKKYAERITLGNMEDDMAKIADCDWVIEVVVERLDIKKKVFEQVEKYRKPGTLVTSNTSGIPIHLMLEGRSDDFAAHFCGTHFFNPPRYLPLLEIIPTDRTKPEVVEFLMDYGRRFLGKTTVLCKDTPAFIANRVGVFAIMDALHIIEEMGLKVEEVDKLTGPVLGRPKSATFRTLDVVGLDTMILVASNLYEAVPHDERRESFKLPKVLKALQEKGWLGEKSGQGFYKKVKTDKGKEILALDFATLDYRPQEKVKFETLDATKAIDDLAKRFKVLVNGKDKAGEFYRKTFASLFAYVSHRIPEIADELYKIDDAVCAGFGWKMGPFATWDAIGVEEGVKLIEAQGLTVAQWVKDMLAAGFTSFYKVEGGRKLYYDVNSKSYQPIPGTENFIILENYSSNIIWNNPGTTLYDIGDGVYCLEMHTKMNAIGAEIIQGLNYAVERAEKEARGLVITARGDNFSAGANLAMLFMYAVEQDWDEINMMIAQFQNTMMRLRYSAIPVVSTPFGLTLGGGCELNLHADHVQAHAETYMGLVEVGVGLIPAGGGTKEMALRLSDSLQEGDVELNRLQNTLMNIAMAKVSTSAVEAYDLGYLRPSDAITTSRAHLIGDAKAKVIELADRGYVQPIRRKDIKVQGRTGLALIKAGLHGMWRGHYISDHDKKVVDKLGYVLCGGDLSSPQLVSEQYLLDLEREAFLSLCGEKKTLERIQAVLTTGRPIRN